MNITKKAMDNHDEIFDGVKYAPIGETRPMSETNPEYVETFLNFACLFSLTKWKSVFSFTISYDPIIRTKEMFFIVNSIPISNRVAFIHKT